MTASAVLPRGRRSRIAFVLAVVAVVGMAVFGARSLFGSTEKPAREDMQSRAASPVPSRSGIQSVELTEKQLAAIKIAPVELRSFETLKTSVGTIDFNQNKTVQVFSQYPGKIVRAFFSLGDTVKKGDILFTVDSPDLLQAEIDPAGEQRRAATADQGPGPRQPTPQGGR